MKIEDLPPHIQELAKRQLADEEPPKKPHKFGAKPKSVDGQRYDSTAEARYHNHLKFLHAGGEIALWMEQPRMMLAGGVWYRPDFLVLTEHLCASCAPLLRVVDIKGVRTKEYRMKVKQVEQTYGIDIVEISPGDI